MATQRMIVATIVGESAAAVQALFHGFTVSKDADAVDRFWAALRANAVSLPVVYFCEWIDRWLMGDLLNGSNVVDGRRCQATYVTPQEAMEWAERCGRQYAEQQWLASRLREATEACGTISERRAVVVIREPVGPSTLDEEVIASSSTIPDWLAAPKDGRV